MNFSIKQRITINILLHIACAVLIVFAYFHEPFLNFLLETRRFKGGTVKALYGFLLILSPTFLSLFLWQSIIAPKLKYGNKKLIKIIKLILLASLQLTITLLYVIVFHNYLSHLLAQTA